MLRILVFRVEGLGIWGGGCMFGFPFLEQGIGQECPILRVEGWRGLRAQGFRVQAFWVWGFRAWG